MIGIVKVQGGHIVGIGEDVRLLDAFFKGGETVRGFDELRLRTARPRHRRCAGRQHLRGRHRGSAVPVPGHPAEIGFKGALFADAGTLFDTDFDPDVDGDGDDDVDVADDAALRSSVGASILWASPLGPIRADFAYVLTVGGLRRDADLPDRWRLALLTCFPAGVR